MEELARVVARELGANPDLGIVWSALGDPFSSAFVRKTNCR
ncbi:MAG: hypothetical protein ACREQ9_27260 [Candidatus Binatia bacterium]